MTLDWNRVTELFDRAQTLPPQEQEDFLSKECAGSEKLQQEVKSLLRASGQAADYLERPAIDRTTIQKMVEEEFDLGADPKQHLSEDYQVSKLLGQGAFASVYLAKEKTLDRWVALKISQLKTSEGKTLANLQHPNIVQVYGEEVSPKSSIRTIKMQYIPGLTLAELMDRLSLSSTGNLETLLNSVEHQAIPFDPSFARDRDDLKTHTFLDFVIKTGIELSDALAHAHTQGYLHSDIKPSNVIVSRYGRAYLMDFNVSSQMDASGSSIAQGGSRLFMSPEHLKAIESRGSGENKINAKCDLYSLAMVLRQLIRTGNWLIKYPGFDFHKTLEEIEALLDRATANHPADRPGSLSDFRDELETIREKRELARNLPIAGPIIRQARKSPFTAFLILTLIPHLVAGLLSGYYNFAQIVSNLNQAQQDVFMKAVIYYNSFWVGGCAIAYLFWVWPICTHLKGRGTLPGRVVRQKVLLLPVIQFAFATLGWMTGAYAFPKTIDVLAGPIDSNIYNYFFASNGLSWWVAGSYSAFAAIFIGLRVFYPILFDPKEGLFSTASRELQHVHKSLLWFYFMSVFAPLIGIGAVFVWDVQTGIESHFGQAFVGLSLVAVSIVSLILMILTSTHMFKTLRAFRVSN